jgi:hypothetical protein
LNDCGFASPSLSRWEESGARPRNTQKKRAASEKVTIMGYLRVVVLVVLSAAGVAACGSDDDEKPGGANSAALERCNQFCDASAGKPCQLVDAPTCKDICSALMQSIDADCANKQKAMYDCNLAQADVCNEDACQTETEAASSCFQ